MEDSQIGNFCRAVCRFNCPPLVRVKENAVMPIRRALDLGAAGVIVPLVNNAEDARRAVQAATFPPDGIRGFAWQRGNEWGSEFDSYAKEFSPLVIVMIESKTAVDNIEEIITVEGVDGCFLGPYDMSGSYGVTGQTEHEVIKDACSRVVEACKQHNKTPGQHIVTPTQENVTTAITFSMFPNPSVVWTSSPPIITNESAYFCLYTS